VRPGVPLTVAKATAPGDLDLAWSDSCSPTHADYAVYEGSIGTWYSHSGLLCSTGDQLSATITPGTLTDDRYYLIVPTTATEEGSYGLDSNGTERPPAATGACRPAQVLTCP
jgi:hypothetical protein